MKRTMPTLPNACAFPPRATHTPEGVCAVSRDTGSIGHLLSGTLEPNNVILLVQLKSTIHVTLNQEVEQKKLV
jgi:hypothetical protein